MLQIDADARCCHKICGIATGFVRRLSGELRKTAAIWRRLDCDSQKQLHRFGTVSAICQRFVSGSYLESYPERVQSDEFLWRIPENAQLSRISW